MNELKGYILILLAGFLLGSLFFSFLWWTVKKMRRTKTPLLFFLFSFIIRISFLFIGFYLIVSFSNQSDWKSLGICLLGFLASRLFVTKVIHMREEVNHRT